MRPLNHLLKTAIACVTLMIAGVTAASAESEYDWAPRAGDELVFDVYRDGKPFGSHVVKFRRSGDRLTVDTDIELKVKFGPITAFHYVHDATEVWADDELLAIDARTKSGGKWNDLSVRAQADGLFADGVGFSGLHPPDLIPSTHWNIDEMSQSHMLSTETGALLPMQVEDLGVEMVKVGEGRIAARHFRVTSDLVASFWYDAEGRWVKCAFEARGSDVEYVLRALPG